MNMETVHELLRRISGHLSGGVAREDVRLQTLYKSLSRSLLPEDVQQLKASRFSFESAEIFSAEGVPPEVADNWRAVAEAAARNKRPEYRVFVREVPVRSALWQLSVPDWAAGAAVDHTIGPFTGKDGRQFWFDFYRIEQLVALYLQGKSDPALLFNTTIVRRIIDASLPALTDAGTSYNLLAGSIWIYARLLAPNTPAGLFTGLTIKGGVIKLSTASQIVDGKVTVGPGTAVSVSLELQQPAVAGDPASPYGVDARAATLELPAKLSFHFTTQMQVIDEVAASHWDVYGDDAHFNWQKLPATYNGALRVVVVPLACSQPQFAVAKCDSPFFKLQGRAQINFSAWALPAAPIDVLHPTAASGIGTLGVLCGKGLSASWKGLNGGELNCNAPAVLAEPGHLSLADLTAGNIYCHETLRLWQDEQNTFGTTIELRIPATTPFFYNSLATGDEGIAALANADVQIDRPVTVAGEALAIRSKNSLWMISASKIARLIYLYDDNILFDSTDFSQPTPVAPAPIGLALRNALFKTTLVNGCVLFGSLAEDFVKISNASLFLSFGVLAYLPTLPDPYAVNLGALRGQLREGRQSFVANTGYAGQRVWLWLISQIKWKPKNRSGDDVAVAFYLGPIQQQGGANPLAATSNVMQSDSASMPQSHPMMMMAKTDTLPDYGAVWDRATQALQQDLFALLDVSTNADLLGISFATFNDRRMAMFATHGATSGAQSANTFPLQVKDLDVISPAKNVRAFTVPQISWEPVLNLSPRVLPGDPQLGPDYYPDDGGPTRIINNGADQVALAPIPLTDFLVNTFQVNDQFAALALFTLPFGLKALGLLQNKYEYGGATRKGTEVLCQPRVFRATLKGARQIQLDGGAPLVEGEGEMFMGCTLQLNNVLELDGTSKGASTLGQTVTKIFNNEFLLDPFDVMRQRGVPLTRIDLSGYGASAFSNWHNPKATIAATSQARFDIFVGRCAHEVIQVKSIVHPWGIRVVRTITLFRTASGYPYRYDSGWRAESDGRFDFTYWVNVDDPAHPLKSESRPAPFETHPGVIHGLFNVREIKETTDVLPFLGKMAVNPTTATAPPYPVGTTYLDEDGKEQPNTTGSVMWLDVELQPVFFNADVEVENPISGHVTKTVEGVERKLVSSRRVLGFVQIKPRGMPIGADSLRDLVVRQGTIGGPLDCVIDFGKSGQQLRVHRFDVNNSFAADGASPIFAAAARGNVILPKDGAWGMVQHQFGTGEVTPVPEDLSIPLIRIGKVLSAAADLVLDKDPATQLLRVANPTELLRNPVSDTINYGFLHTTDTQKALFLTPSFSQGLQKMLSKTPPLFADAVRIVNSKGIFPNVGDAVSNIGDAISLVTTGTEFIKNALKDGNTNVLEVMGIDKVVAGVKETGYELLKQVEDFDLPSKAWTLIELGGAFKIYLEYRANKVKKKDGSTKDLAGSLDFDIDSFANNLADRWKSRMANVALVVDLGPISRLITVKGTWDAKNGSSAQYGGNSGDADFPTPQIEFAPELKPIIEILQILQDLQSANYTGAFEKGLKLAMSNKAGTWEYKLEASKEIPVVRFPVPDELYNAPETPLKLEAGLKLGAYFNTALKVTTDPKQLLPTAGAYLGFTGKLSVMCVSLYGATIYAVGQAQLDIAADTLKGPSLHMKFGFGAQIAVGLPVVGNVSVLYMVGVEMYVDSTKLNVSAFLLFQGNADLLGGLVAVTITIEAKGTISRDNSAGRTDLAAQVTFGLDISIFLIIDISFSTSWQEQRQIA